MGVADGDRIPDGLHIHATTEVRGVVLPPWFVALMLIFFVLMSTGLLHIWSELDELSTKHWLLKDYTRGRISHLPYNPPEDPNDEHRGRTPPQEDHR